MLYEKNINTNLTFNCGSGSSSSDITPAEMSKK